MTAQLQTINIGAAPNDGTGDPIRTAFTKINNDFSFVWAAGPVGSNIKINNNTISAENTNGNLLISANGNGTVVVSSSMVPAANNVQSLGSAQLYFNGGYFGTEGVYSIGDLNVGGNALVNGLSVSSIFTLEPRTIGNSATAGTVGEIAWDSDYIYVCVSQDSWKRIELESF
jgi:hypothetical protein